MGNFKVPEDNLFTDLGKLLEEGLFSDITLIVGDQRFPVHKALLASRSPVFAGMFRHIEMEENKQGIVQIKDLEPDVLKEMLKYIYTGKASQLETMASDLLSAADKVRLLTVQVPSANMLLNYLIILVRTVPGASPFFVKIISKIEFFFVVKTPLFSFCFA